MGYRFSFAVLLSTGRPFDSTTAPSPFFAVCDWLTRTENLSFTLTQKYNYPNRLSRRLDTYHGCSTNPFRRNRLIASVISDRASDTACTHAYTGWCIQSRDKEETVSTAIRGGGSEWRPSPKGEHRKHECMYAVPCLFHKISVCFISIKGMASRWLCREVNKVVVERRASCA